MCGKYSISFVTEIRGENHVFRLLDIQNLNFFSVVRDVNALNVNKCINAL